jgi:hypothetical protein
VRVSFEPGAIGPVAVRRADRVAPNRSDNRPCHDIYQNDPASPIVAEIDSRRKLDFVDGANGL